MEAISGVLSRALRRVGLEHDLQGWRAVDEWARIVGPRVARHTRAVAFRGGTLRVEVEGSAWMHELGFLKRDLIQRVNRHLGAELVRDLRFYLAPGGNLR